MDGLMDRRMNGWMDRWIGENLAIPSARIGKSYYFNNGYLVTEKKKSIAVILELILLLTLQLKNPKPLFLH